MNSFIISYLSENLNGFHINMLIKITKYVRKYDINVVSRLEGYYNQYILLFEKRMENKQTKNV